MGVQSRLNGVVCAKCGKPKIVRPDGGLLCSDCERKALEQFAKMRPDLAKKGKLKIVWQPLDNQE